MVLLRFEENLLNRRSISNEQCPLPPVSSAGICSPSHHYVTVFGDIPPSAGLQTHLTDGIEHLRHPPPHAGLQVDSFPGRTHGKMSFKMSESCTAIKKKKHGLRW